MLLRNVYITEYHGPQDIRIAGNKILSVTYSGDNAFSLGAEPFFEAENALAFPGLINSHDHLDFNLFPQLSNGLYKNYTAWGKDIHQTYRDIIARVSAVPQSLRTHWGIYKNLLNGVTTVVNHGDRLDVPDQLIHIFQKSNCLHSARFEKNWKYKLNTFFNGSWPVVIHAGEGTDEEAHREIDEIINWNFLHKKLIAVHGVAMDERQSEKFNALVWCPASNYFLLGQTAPVDRLKKNCTILFGTDSTLTANWNLWEHLRLARSQNMLSDAELVSALTTNAASVWQLKDKGKIAANNIADIVVTRLKQGSKNYTDQFFDSNPEDMLLVVCNGNVLLFDEVFCSVMENDSNRFTKCFVGESCKYVLGDLQSLVNAIHEYLPDASLPVSLEQQDLKAPMPV